ncbi:hypothetical protein [Chryseolinea sp. H1M3-3]|uniref:hypothetical protein n=1 Tax=Chryseolinea sp. H1M3-3 TaxID=3034144 RepID=UPI0023EC4F14|nr:hypothetical protein [Chryseolinea sp. H1M3-3]
MKNRFTYKELTLVAGIAVALIVIFTLWIRKPAYASFKTSTIPALSKFYSVKKVQVEAYINAFGVLFSSRNNPY